MARNLGHARAVEAVRFILVPKVLLLASTKNRDLWGGLTPEVRDLRTSRHACLESSLTILLAENTKRILCACSGNWTFPEVAILGAHQTWAARPLGTRMKDSESRNSSRIRDALRKQIQHSAYLLTQVQSPKCSLTVFWYDLRPKIFLGNCQLPYCNRCLFLKYNNTDKAM